MKIIIDTREQEPLEFPNVVGASYERACLAVGDYGCLHDDGEEDKCVVERKSVADLFNSYSRRYDDERAKILKAKELGKFFILAIERPILEVRGGCRWMRGGQIFESKKSGRSMVKQIMTVSRKYDVPVWFCESREAMAYRIFEYFKAHERLKP